MNASERFDRDLGDMMAELAQPRFPDYFDEVLERAVANRQRPAWTFPERWFPMGILSRRLPFVPALPARAVHLLLILLLLLAAAVAIGVGALLREQRPAPPFGLAANGVVAYSYEGDIYTRDLVTGESRLIVGGSTVDEEPWFSRDGTRVIFVRVLETEPTEVIEVIIAEANGANLRTLIGPVPGDEVGWLELSPDGLLLAVANPDTAQLSVVDTATGARTPLELPVEAELFEWLPDSSAIVFRGIDGEPAIYFVRPDGSDFRQLTDPIPGMNYSTRLQVSHNGRYVGYNARVGGTHQIYLFDMRSEESRPILPPSGGHVGHPVFAPDDLMVAYVSYEEGSSTAQVVVAPLESAPDGAVDVGPAVPVGAYQMGLTALFSPDSTSLLITSDAGEVWLADLESGTYEPVDLSKDDFEIAWQRRAP